MTPSKRQPLSPRDFKHIFEEAPGGAQILEHLIARFGGAPYVKGGHEADRETCYRAGQRAVVDYIVAMINRSNGIHEETQPNE
ncbi:hypothetical protein [Enterobacter bugandensis]|uniref:Bbp19 family protein n=1 Tax=Enterobacter bugandensis TaxID=881260 RepID=UPI0020033EFC|nr:hypothetical protein [Enterobacter bugandensis]MCK7435905.1 hypothetical protein [Enterobacter bugandensis]